MLGDAIEKNLRELLEYKLTSKTEPEVLKITVTITGTQAIMLRVLKEAVKGHSAKNMNKLFDHIINAGIERVHEALLETMMERVFKKENENE